MNESGFNFNNEQFNRLFPFYILIDKKLKIIANGKSLDKICSVNSEKLFSEFFIIKRPEIHIKQFDDLPILKNQLILLETITNNPIILRGQFEYLINNECYLFVGTPWFYSMDQVRNFKLNLHDFAFHDPMFDLLHVLKNQEINTHEIETLLRTVNDQKNKLKESESNYRSIVEKATDIIYKCNLQGEFMFVNEIAQRITGYSKEELLTMKYLQLIREDYQEKAHSFYIHQIENKIPTTYYEFPITTKQGKEMWIGQSVQLPQEESSDTEFTALAINVSERKLIEQNLILQEEKYRNIIANMNLGLLEVDKDDVIQYANQSFTNMSGYSLDELIGKKAANLLLTEKEKEIIEHKNDTRKKGISDMYSVPIRDKKGELRWWAISGAPRYNDNGDLVGSVGIHLDITDQKHLEEQLKVAKLKAEESSKAKESFLATMSHEIRTPLNAIIGITDLMQINAKTRNKENFDILSFSAKNLLALITDILDLSKIDAGKIELSKNQIEIKQLINGIYQTFKATCEEKNIELILNIEDKIPEFILGDELRLSQIINNLISNAVKFTPKGFVKINVNATYIEQDKIRLDVQVIDSGIGIKKNKIETIFASFEQADNKIVRQFGGTGLGLSITKKLIELQGGEIQVNSKLNKGTVFSFYVEYEVSKNIKKHGASKKIAIKVEQFRIKDKTILLVEDNLVNQKVAVSYLHNWGFKFEIANNGLEALDLLSKQHFDLALIDLFMPMMDGFQTIKKIRKNKLLKGFPIIALTASAEIKLMDKAVKIGADKCLTKPFNALQLLDTIKGLLSIEIMASNEIHTLDDKIENTGFKCISLKRIEEASLGSKQFVADMLKILSKEIPELITESEHVFNEGNYELFSKLIHKLKNNMLMLNMETLREDLHFIEEYSKRKENLNEVFIRFKKLKSIWNNAIPEMKLAMSRLI